MTMISVRNDQLVDPDNDLIPGLSDVEWAERAYHHPAEPMAASSVKAPRIARRPPRRRLRLLVAAGLIAAAGIVLLAIQARPSTATPQAKPVTSLMTNPGEAPKSATRPILTPPLVRPLPFSFLEIETPRR